VKLSETKCDSLLTVLDCKRGEDNNFSRHIVLKPYKQQRVCARVLKCVHKNKDKSGHITTSQS